MVGWYSSTASDNHNSPFTHTHTPADRLEEDELEDVVEDEPLARGILTELEALGVAKRALLVIDLFAVLDGNGSVLSSRFTGITYNELAGNEDDDTAVSGGLGIGLAVLVLDLLEGEGLFGLLCQFPWSSCFPIWFRLDANLRQASQRYRRHRETEYPRR